MESEPSSSLISSRPSFLCLLAAQRSGNHPPQTGLFCAWYVAPHCTTSDRNRADLHDKDKGSAKGIFLGGSEIEAWHSLKLSYTATPLVVNFGSKNGSSRGGASFPEYMSYEISKHRLAEARVRLKASINHAMHSPQKAMLSPHDESNPLGISSSRNSTWSFSLIAC